MRYHDWNVSSSKVRRLRSRLERTPQTQEQLVGFYREIPKELIWIVQTVSQYQFLGTQNLSSLRGETRAGSKVLERLCFGRAKTLDVKERSSNNCLRNWSLQKILSWDKTKWSRSWTRNSWPRVKKIDVISDYYLITR